MGRTYTLQCRLCSIVGLLTSLAFGGSTCNNLRISIRSLRTRNICCCCATISPPTTTHNISPSHLISRSSDFQIMVSSKRAIEEDVFLLRRQTCWQICLFGFKGVSYLSLRRLGPLRRIVGRVWRRMENLAMFVKKDF